VGGTIYILDELFIHELESDLLCFAELPLDDDGLQFSMVYVSSLNFQEGMVRLSIFNELFCLSTFGLQLLGAIFSRLFFAEFSMVYLFSIFNQLFFH
jgi:hypothetical protein